MTNSANIVSASIAEIGKALGQIQSATAETASASENVAQEAQGMTGGVAKLEELLAQFKYDNALSGMDSPRVSLSAKGKRD